jgi:anti-sigma regulatory factor (Ser/Thr protein kinase)
MYSSQSTRRAGDLDRLFQWGDHACHFYRSAEDLGEVLVPYFKTGLEGNERCLWVTARPYGKDRAFSEMRTALADFDRRIAAGQMQIFGEDEWYAKLATQRTAEKLQSWASQKDEATALGYVGLRVSGNTSFLDENSWDEFLIYERAFDEAFKDQRVVALCSYPFEGCSADAALDVSHCHRHGLAKRHERWDLIEVRRHDCEATITVNLTHPAALLGGVDLREVIEDQLAIFIEACPERIALHGVPVHLTRAQATQLAILFSELTTNAAKYGALSSTEGQLLVQWRVLINGSRRLHISWTESGMSKLTISKKIGQGTQLLARLAENGSRVFLPTGMECTFEVDLGSTHRGLR